ncbi:MAG: enoyl-CoA hydratase-related protein [Sphingopyxis sp.]|uniref:enoyl-CoA hydratase/isomerase family protein n=1 Tax=Sphingopyxis sp. TaxID=1908224 RepID=UPI002AB9E03D|nr:enoyl-CoA hydratase-related protein [Sphingopyxis sp.]MDZ3833535.1 enoyl-CoA hydratase-related protein [Sphingopyxis sp.]
MTPCLLVQRTGHVATLTLNRPEARNAFSPELAVRLDEACQQLRDDREVRAIVLAAAGTDSFCAGGDLKLMIPLITGARKAETDYDHAALALMREKGRPLPTHGDIGKPLIAAIEAPALGGGLELALACDMIVASENASFAAPEVASGAYPARITYLLPRRLPYSLASEMLLSGSRLSATRAYHLGLVNELVPAGTAIAAAQKLAERIARNAPISVRSARAVAHLAMSDPAADVDGLDRAMIRKVYTSQDAREGPRAFAEKRAPVFCDH